MTTCHVSKNISINNEGKKTDNHSQGLHQNVIVRILNDTQYSLSLIKKSLSQGRWHIKPPLMIKPKSNVEFHCKTTTRGEIEGNAEYFIHHGDFKFYWDLSDSGYLHYTLTVNDPKSLYNIYVILRDEGPSRREVFGIHVEEKSHS